MRKQYHSRHSAAGRLIWDVQRLVQLTSTFKVKTVRVDSIMELDEPYWFEVDAPVPTCRQIADHAKLISETDLKYPIIFSADGRVMDGMHRVAKAYIQGLDVINAVQFDADPEPDFINVDLNTLPYD